jgi:hypothetical protein
MNVNLIEVRLAYRGAVDIPQGQYAADDPALHDMADYLVRMGHARIVGQVVREPETVQTSSIVDSPKPAPKPAASKPPVTRRKKRA